MERNLSVLGVLLCGIPVACGYEGLQRPKGVAEMQVPLPPGTPPEAPQQAAAADHAHRESLALYARARRLDAEGKCSEAEEVYGQYAASVRRFDPASATMAIAYASLCRPHAFVDPRTTEADSALMAHDYTRVLAITEAPAAQPAAAWLDLDRAAASVALGRTDEAVEVYRRADRFFTAVADGSGRSQALWGQAHALDQAGRCDEAKQAYAEYARFVRPADPRAADMALTYSADCRTVVLMR
jgi:tetratricopeptide (TPR) repeat protein